MMTLPLFQTQVRRSLQAVAFVLVLVSAATSRLAAAALPDLWRERIQSVVAVEFFTATELDRRPTVTAGVVVDDQGLIVLPPGAVSPRVTPAQLQDFRVYIPGEPSTRYRGAEYLGQDALTGWNFIRVEEAMRAKLTPLTAFAAATPREPSVAEDIWGIALRGKDEDFLPYFLMGKVGLVQSLPQRTAVALQEVASPGLPVFDRDGALMGIAVGGFGSTFLQFSRSERGSPVMLMNVEESRVFQVTAEILPNLGRVPATLTGRPVPWLGAYGLEPMDPDVAVFLKLADQSGAVVSEVLEGSPAEAAGIRERDILLAIDGQPLPRLKPDRVVIAYVEREIMRRAPGAEIRLSVLRGSERLELKATLAEEPKLLREAGRTFFERLGFTAREFIYADGVNRRVKPAEHRGVIAHFVKNNSPVGVAGLRSDDWIREVDGVEVRTYAEAIEKLSAINADTSRTDCVLLASRNGETSVLRVKLN